MGERAHHQDPGVVDQDVELAGPVVGEGPHRLQVGEVERADLGCARHARGGRRTAPGVPDGQHHAGSGRAERAYGQSKLANLLFTLELQRRLSEAHSAVRAVAAHPGWAATNLQSRSGSRVKDAALAAGNVFLGASPEQGAQPTLVAATADLPGGSYVGPSGPFELRGRPALVGRTAAASDPGVARRLWEASAQLTGVDFPASLPA